MRQQIRLIKIVFAIPKKTKNLMVKKQKRRRNDNLNQTLRVVKL